MLSKAKIKYIRSLELKKYRKAGNVFLAEGPKLVEDLLGHFTCKLIAASPEWFATHPSVQADECIKTDATELAKASLLKSPQEVLAVFEQPSDPLDYHYPQQSLCLALDDIQDPGNLGTIIRLADWFGIEHIYCSLSTVDVYNPKAVQATMGALARVKLHYTSLTDCIEALNAHTPVYGTFLKGDNLYTQKLSSNGLIVMGNEGNGISPDVEKLINRRLYIPNYPMERSTSESLNVAMATAIVCAEFRRQILQQ